MNIVESETQNRYNYKLLDTVRFKVIIKSWQRSIGIERIVISFLYYYYLANELTNISKNKNIIDFDVFDHRTQRGSLMHGV